MNIKNKIKLAKYLIDSNGFCSLDFLLNNKISCNDCDFIDCITKRCLPSVKIKNAKLFINKFKINKILEKYV